MRHLRLHRYGVACWAAVMGVLLVSGTARAQRVGDGRRLYQEQLRVKLDEQQVAARTVGIDAGGWLSFGLFNYDDKAAEKTRTLRQYEIRAWGSATFAGVHDFYVRGMFGYDDWNMGDNPNGETGDAHDEELERAWYRFDYNRLVRNRTGADPEVGFWVQVGREYHEIGSALVLALPLDAVRIVGHVGGLQLTGLLGKTITHTPNIDDSAAVSDHMDRNFYGIELRHIGLDRHEPYIYYLFQRDHTDEWGRDPTLEYTYHSNYLGVGSSGSVLTSNLRYSFELVFESGESSPRTLSGRREDIHAMALDALVEYFFDVPGRPRIEFEYLWGSGDRDRTVSANSTVGGNTAGTDDNAFNAFGFRDTGLAFAPRIANLHIWQLGISVNPLEQMQLFRKMEVGTKVYFYAKDHSGGAISDALGTRNATWVGWEWDAFCNWRITSDVSLTARYGFFQPGEAFQERDCRQFFYSGLTYSF